MTAARRALVTGASSGICKAPDPAAVMTAMLEALARAWAARSV